MPGKTNTEAIRELEKTVAVLEEQSASAREDIKRLQESQSKLVELLAKLETRVTVVEEKFADLKKSLEEAERRRWQIWLALIGAGLSLAGNIILWFVRK